MTSAAVPPYLCRNQLLLFLLFFIFNSFISPKAFAQTSIKGIVLDQQTKEELVGATVLIKGTSEGTATAFDGSFEFSTQQPLPCTLQISYAGYAQKEVLYQSTATTLTIELAIEAFVTDVIEVKVSGYSDKEKKEPLTIESIGLISIQQTPSESFYDGIGNLKEADLSIASMGFKVVNTRGFNSTIPIRSLQLIDGMDNASPSLNFALGNFLGVGELDILKVDLVVGASSAFYGPNAFNGVISMKTKNPFLHKGLSVQIKGGEQNLREGAIRWADAIKNKAGNDFFAYKLNFSHWNAEDWEANNFGLVDESKVAFDNPGGIDAVNRYGDEFDSFYDYSTSAPWTNPGLGIFYRTGYKEVDLVDYGTNNTKASLALHFKTAPNKKLDSPELIFSGSYGTGTTVAQTANRVSLKDISFVQARVEWNKRDKYFLRAYTTFDDFGKSYDPVSTAYKLQELAKEKETWGEDYFRIWTEKFKPQMFKSGFPRLVYDPGTQMLVFDQDAADAWYADPVHRDSLNSWHAQTRRLADLATFGIAQEEETADFLMPGTERFKKEVDRITSTLNNADEKGTRYHSRSNLIHLHGEYIFEPTFMNKITLGSNLRFYNPETKGTILQDTAGTTIHTYEWGTYLGLEKMFAAEKLTATATLRMDKHANFNYLFTPAASLVWQPRPDDYLRLSFSSGIRNPILIEQYLFLETGRAILKGNLQGVDSLFTTDSFDEYRKDLDLNKLRYFNLDPIQPEKVKTVELGYRTTLFDKLYLDAGYYYNIYDDFLGYRIGIEAEFDEQSFLPKDLQVFRVSANSKNRVTTQGFSLGTSFYFRKYYQINGNYSWNRLNKKFPDDPIIPAFNTPEHKYNIGISGRNMPIHFRSLRLNNFGFSIHYKYVNGFLFEASPQFTGFVNTYSLLDAQINFLLKKINTRLKLGASNILNKAIFQSYGSPAVGRLAYLSITYEFKKETTTD